MSKTFKHRWRENGRHRQRTFDTRAERDTFIARLRLKPDAAPGRSTLTVADFATTWLEQHVDVEKSRTQAARMRVVVDTFLVPAFGDVRLCDLAAEHLLELRASLKDKPMGRYKRVLRPKTVNEVLQAAKQLAKAAVGRGLIAVNPFAAVKKLRVPEQPYGFWTADERDRFLRFCRQLDPAFAELVLVAVNTGLRKGELWALTRGDLDFEGRKIRVAATFDHKLEERLPRTKNGKVGYVEMNSLVVAALRDRELMAASAPVFDEDLLRDACHRLKRRALEVGVPAIRFHDLRHTFASNLVAAGVPIYDVQRLLRHESIAMTQRYAHHAPGHLASAVEALVRGVCAQPPKLEEAPVGASVSNLNDWGRGVGPG